MTEKNTSDIWKLSTRCLLITAVAIVLLSTLTIPASGQANDPGNYTLQEMRNDGLQRSDSPVSVRAGNQGEMFWMVYWPSDRPWASPGDDTNWEYLSSSTTVLRNNVYLRGINNQDESQSRTLKIVYWRSVPNENATGSSLQVAATETKQIQMGTGWFSQRIRLRNFEQPVEVTMWMADAPGTLRWRFSHRSAATTKGVGIDTAGDYLWKVLLQFIGPTVIGLFVVGGVSRRLIDRAKIGPQKGLLFWAVVFFVGVAILLRLTYRSIAGLIVDLPWLLSLLVIGIIGVVILETYTRNLRRVLFFKPDVETAVSPGGGDGRDMLAAEVEEQTVAETEDGLMVTQSGIPGFIARLFGKRAVIENATEIKSRVKTPDSEWDEIFFVDPEAESVLDHEPEGLEFSVPEITRDNASRIAVGALMVAGIATMAVGAVLMGGFSNTAQSGTLGALIRASPVLASATVVAVVGAVTLKPTGGSASFSPAPVHMASAYASMLVLTEEYEDAKLVDTARERLWEERIRSEQEIESVVEGFDATLVEQMHDWDAGRAIEEGADSTATAEEEVSDE